MMRGPIQLHHSRGRACSCGAAAMATAAPFPGMVSSTTGAWQHDVIRIKRSDAGRRRGWLGHLLFGRWHPFGCLLPGGIAEPDLGRDGREG